MGLRRVDGDWYTIANAKTGLVLNVVNGEGWDDARLQRYPNDGIWGCHFRFIEVGNSQHIVQKRLASERIIDLDNGNTSNGKNVHLWPFHNASNGCWLLEKADTGTSSYTAYVTTTGKNLNLRSAPRPVHPVW